jgi:hypothetical protein
MTAAAPLTLVESVIGHSHSLVLTVALSIVTVGSIVTCLRRTARIISDLESRSATP